MKGDRTLFVAVLALAFVLRTVWPLADPPATLSWSGGILTDPAAVVQAARTAASTGHWDASRDFLFYPLMNVLTWAAFSSLGVSRLATQWLSALLSTVAVAGFALALGRLHGPRARLAGALVLATSYWLGMFGRVPLVENLTSALLGVATFLAVSGPRGRIAAAGVGAVAMFFGKAHAAPFAAALLLFPAWRAGSPGALRGPVAAFAGVAALWVATVLLPFHSEIVDQVREVGASSLPRSPWLAPLETIRTSWLCHRMPVLSVAGLWFVVQTLVVPDRRRERVATGSALLALAVVLSWIYTSLLPYQAPRYHVPTAYAFVAGAVAWAAERTGDGPRRRPSRIGSAGNAAAGILFTFLLALGLLEGGVHLATLVDGGTRVKTGLPSEAANRLLAFLHPFGRNVFLAGALAVGVGAALRVRGCPRLPTPGRRTLRLGTVVAISIATAQWVVWGAHRTASLEDARRSIARVLPEEARLGGTFAPALALGTKLHAIPSFAADPVGEGLRRGATHLVLESPGADGPAARLESEHPGQFVELGSWELRHRHVRRLRLFARRGPGFPGTRFERAVADLAAGNASAAIRSLQEGAGGGTADELALEARARFVSGDRDGARDCLERAVRIRPTTRELLHLGQLAADSGNRERARECWMDALALYPWDADVIQALQRLRP